MIFIGFLEDLWELTALSTWKLHIKMVACVCNVCGTGANPMLENDSGHRPIAYVKSQQIKELLQESEQKV